MSSEAVPPKRVSWLWYFIGIGFVAVVLLLFLALFVQNQLDQGQQLKMEQLQAARKLWDAKGPKDYQMLYTVRRAGDKNPDRFFVEVRGGKVQNVVLNGSEQLPADQLDYRSMRSLFNDIELFLIQDARPESKPVFCRAYFDQSDGHLVAYIRRVIGGTERVEIEVKEFRPAKDK